MNPKQKQLISTMFPDLAPQIGSDSTAQMLKAIFGGIQMVKGEKGDKGDSFYGSQGERGEKGDKGERGEKGDKGERGEMGLQGKKGDRGDVGKDGKDGRDGRDAVFNFDIQEYLKPINKRINEISTTLNPKGKIDQRWHGGGLSRVYTDATLTGTGTASNPLSVVSSPSGSGYQTATGTVDGSNTSFTFSSAPNAIVVDGVSLRKTASDGTVNWTGTTTITLTVAPNFDIYAVA